MIWCREPLTPFQGLILSATVLTFGAAAWEFLGNKLTTSAQEIRFQQGTDELLKELRDLWGVVQNKRTLGHQAVEEKWESFTDNFLDIAANIFSVRHFGWNSKAHSGLMVKDPDNQSLILKKFSTGAGYKPGLKIPIPYDNNYEESGPAALAFKEKTLVYVPKVYVPKKEREHPKNAWPFCREWKTSRRKQQPEREEFYERPAAHLDEGFYYKAGNPQPCWKPSAEQEQEKFRTVLCIPIPSLGVLNFSTKRRDPFIDRDFFMAECLAAFLAQANAFTRGRR